MGPSGGVPEGGVVVIGGDSSTCVPAPEDLPVGRDVEAGTVRWMTPAPCRPGLMCMFVSF